MSAPAAPLISSSCRSFQADLLAVIRKYVKVDDDDVEVKMQREDDVSSLEINVEMPARAKDDAKADAGTGSAKKA